MLVLDEADEMLNMGFREDIDTIIQSAPEEKQFILFSAHFQKLFKILLANIKKMQSVSVCLKKL